MANGLSRYGGSIKCMKSSSTPISTTPLSAKPGPHTAFILPKRCDQLEVHLTPVLEEPPPIFPSQPRCPRPQEVTWACGAVFIGLEGTAPSTSSCQEPVTLM